jgi:hypothetical protein
MSNCPKCGNQTQPYSCTSCNTVYCPKCPSPIYQPNVTPISACPSCGNGGVTLYYN